MTKCKNDKTCKNDMSTNYKNCKNDKQMTIMTKIAKHTKMQK